MNTTPTNAVERMRVVNCLDRRGRVCVRGFYGGRPSPAICEGCDKRRPMIASKPAIRFVPINLPAERPYDGSEEWAAMHRRALAYAGDAAAELAWLASLALRLPCGKCRRGFRAWLASHPPRLTDQRSYWRWTVKTHNHVRVKQGRKRWTQRAARRRWRDG